MNSALQQASRIIVKVGSSLVTDEGRGLDHTAIARWAAQIAALRALGKDVVLVSSGAIAEGMLRLGFAKRPTDIHELQACAACGQMGLAQIYESSFSAHGVKTAQVLLTHADLADRERYLNARSTLTTLLRLDVVPIINENDTVVTDEIKFGDNDTLGALVANLIEADALVILTDQPGLYSSDPRKDPNAQLIEQAQAARSGAHTVIAWGREPDVLTRLAGGESIGTQLLAATGRLTARRQWMVDHLHTTGEVVIDAGAVAKLTKEGKSLLPIGVLAVNGEFGRGQVITCVDEAGKPLARGLTNYASSEVRRIMRHSSTEIERILGFVEGPELVHRDNMVLL